MINRALGGDVADQMEDFFNLPFSMASVILKELINVIPNLVGKIGKGILKIATLGQVEVDEPKLKVFDTKEDAMKLKKLLNNLMGAKVYLTIGPREHDPAQTKSAFYSEMRNYGAKDGLPAEIIFKESPGQFTHANEIKVGKTYKR